MYTKRFIGVFALLVGCIALAGGEKTPAELRQQLVATADQGRKMAEETYRMGQGTTDQLLEWTQRWVEARLAAAANHQERLDALKDGVKVAQDRESDMLARQRAGIAMPTDLVAAKYMRIQAELALANEK